MKNQFLILLGLSVFMFVSCEKDDECHPCHIAFTEEDGSEHEHDIGEFCGDDLNDVELNGYTVMGAALIHDGDTYEIGHVFSADMVHCEEHADHD